MNPESRLVLPPVAFRSFAQSFVAPEIAEGFADITTVDFEVSQVRPRSDYHERRLT